MAYIGIEATKGVDRLLEWHELILFEKNYLLYNKQISNNLYILLLKIRNFISNI